MKPIILTLHKKGDANNPTNYIEIYLCDVWSKLYSAIINRRLQEWIQDNNTFVHKTIQWDWKEGKQK